MPARRRVNGITPGLVKTDFARAPAGLETRARAEAACPLRRLDDPEAIAGETVAGNQDS